MPITKQPIFITTTPDGVEVHPPIRDLFEDEEIQWICDQPNWEAVFKQAGANTPFADDTFGPGLNPVPTVIANKPLVGGDAQVEEIQDEGTGEVNQEAPEGDYHYTVAVLGTEPVSARVRFFRGKRGA